MNIGPDWAMVIITGIYVVATIVITISNIMTIREMRQEYYEQIILTSSPHLFISRIDKADKIDYKEKIMIGNFPIDDNIKQCVRDYTFSVKNAGNVPAESVLYKWEDESGGFGGTISDLLPEHERIVSLNITICPYNNNKTSKLEKTALFSYRDPIGNSYVQYVVLYFAIENESVEFEKCVNFPIIADPHNCYRNRRRMNLKSRRRCH